MRNTTQNRTLKSYTGLVLLLVLALAGPALAQVDMSNYVALGDSLGAGFMSGGLVDQAQQYSYPAHIYRQAQGTLDGFDLPTVSPPGIPPLLQLASLRPLIIRPAAGFGAPTNLFLPQPYRNLSVPGADINDVLNTRTDNGGLHDVILRGLGTQLEQALFQQPSFATLWVSNDALSAAISGIVIDDVTLTSAAAFETRYRTVVGALAGSGVPLALATIPDVTTIPFVTTIPPILVDPATNEPVIVNGNTVPLIGPDGPLTLGRDFVLLRGSAELALGLGIPPQLGGTGPLSDQAVLSAAEVATITQRVAAFNAVIRAVAGETGAALVDVNGIFAEIAAGGFHVGGIEYTTDLVTGGIFSLDGIHPTAFGYAVLANYWIEAINETYGAEVPPVNLFPFVFGPLASLGLGFPLGVQAPSQVVFTPKADRQLRFALGIPSRAELNRIKQRLARGGS